MDCASHWSGGKSNHSYVIVSMHDCELGVYVGRVYYISCRFHLSCRLVGISESKLPHLL